MENLFRHVECLLAYHDYVIVPELGGFVVQNQSATLLPDRIVPPLATVSFNALMQHTDGLLALETARAEGLTYRQAEEAVQREVANIKRQFNQNDFFKFGNIGFFKYTAEGTLLFTPIAKVDFLPTNNCKIDIYVSDNYISVLKPSKRFSIISTLRYAAAVTLLFGLSLFAPQNTNTVQQTANLLNFEFPKLPEPEILLVDTITDATYIEIHAEPENISVENSGSYEVIVSCLNTRSAAEKYSNTLINSGFSNTRIVPVKRLYMVSLQNFEIQNDAVKYMQEIRRSDPQFKEAWVFCK